MPKKILALLIILLLWNIMGLLSFFYHVFIFPEAVLSMDQAQQDLANQYPLWTNIVFAIATFGGTIGNIGLLLGKAWSKNILVMSLGAIIIQMTHSLGFTASLEVYGTEAIYMPLLVVLIGVYLVYLSNKGMKEGWLK